MIVKIHQKRPNSDGTYTYDENVELIFMPLEVDEVTKLMETITSHSQYECEVSVTMTGGKTDV